MLLEQKASANVLAVIDAYLAVEDMPERRLSMTIYGHNLFLERLRSGEITSMTTRKYDEIMITLATKWPRGAKWPKQVPLPDGPGLPKLVAVENPRNKAGKKAAKPARKKAA